MANIKKQLAGNFDNFPEEIRAYFSSEISGLKIKKIIGDYDLEADSVYNLVFDVINSNFDFSCLEGYLKEWGMAGAGNAGFSADFIGRIFLPIDDYFPDKDIRQELVSLGGRPEDYREDVQDFRDFLEDRSWAELDKVIDAYESMDQTAEKQAFSDLVSNYLVDILKSPGEETRRLNSVLLYLLNEDPAFKSELSRIVFQNKLLLTAQPLVLEGKKQDPTVANWLIDFISYKGSGMFNALDLADYLANSANVKVLGETEKSLVRSLFDFYRNVAFFPESMKQTPEDSRAIFPLKLQASKDEGAIKRRPVKPAQHKSQESPVNASFSTEGQDEARIRELEEALKVYEPSTLEHRAIKQEIDRLRSAGLKK